MRSNHLFNRAGLIVLLLVAAQGFCESGSDLGVPNYAEKLGFKPGDRVVIFHGDDAGLSHGTNTGTIEAYEKGLLSSVSVMMPTPWVPEIVRYVKAHPGADFGLHLTMTSEWHDYRWPPLAGKNQVPGMVDPEGCMWHGVDDVIQHASADEIEMEIRAQIDRAETMGFPYTHLDSHMGTLFSKPEYFQRFMKVGLEKHIPILAAGGHLTYAQKENPLAVMMLRPLAKQIWDAGLPVIDDIHTASYGWKKKDEKLRNYIQTLHELKPGITEIIMHCIHDTCEFPPISDSGPIRIGDFEAMTSPELKKAIQDEKIILTSWRELTERRKAAGK
ncbi:polysaccharide deacetylase family protein [Candidatus Sumerlaeota bacterium]|nr:polysaccharide deacetylase family protein [Candidatus Sumerlaeota bacterium]